MGERTSPSLSSRKQPKQARSEQLVTDILTAAAQVLAREGAHRFTTARVAEKAGVSVGSLYQYFPNKAAILFRLQQEEWAETGDMLLAVLSDGTRPPIDRLRLAVRSFVQSECDEAAMRIALDDAAPFYRHAPEARAPRRRGTHVLQDFLAATLPDLPDKDRAHAGELMANALASAGKRISEELADGEVVLAQSDALADMLCAYLVALADRPVSNQDPCSREP